MRAASILVWLVVLAQTILAQNVPAWKNWQYVAPVVAEATASRRLVAVALPAAVTERAAAAWADVRVIDAQGGEVAYVLRARRGGLAAEWRATRLLEPSFVSGQFTQAVIDTGSEPRVHNSARLHLQDQDFLSWAEMAVSDDLRSWRVTRSRAPLYSLRTDTAARSTDISYPDSTARYLRVRLLDGSRRYVIEGVDVAYEVPTAAELLPSGVTLVAGENLNQRSTWTSQSPGPRVPIAEVRFETSQALFDRPVSVETSTDGAQWVSAASGEIYRLQERGQPRVSLAVKIPEAAASYWRVTVYNHDDPPVADLQPTLQTIPRRVVFWQEPGQQYRVLYGHSRVAPPTYDIAKIVDADVLDSAVPLALGDSQANPGFADPAPWSERHPVVLWAAVGVAAAVLGLLVIGTLRGT